MKVAVHRNLDGYELEIKRVFKGINDANYFPYIVSEYFVSLIELQTFCKNLNYAITSFFAYKSDSVFNVSDCFH